MHRSLNEGLRLRSPRLVERGGIGVDPTYGEALSGRPQAIRERQLRHDPVADDRHRVHLDTVDELLDDHLAAVRERQGCVEARLEIVDALEPEDAALAAR